MSFVYASWRRFLSSAGSLPAGLRQWRREEGGAGEEFCKGAPNCILLSTTRYAQEDMWKNPLRIFSGRYNILIRDINEWKNNEITA
ncbi:MAG: hypothetical protein KKG76_11285 [Euryarchaeota archaeon]|nr:hypothetical protein [Euryarchaeota archaeon]